MRVIVFFFMALGLFSYGYLGYKSSPYFLIKDRLGLDLPYFGSDEIASAKDGGFGNALYIVLFKVNDAISVCGEKGVLRVVDYSYESDFFNKSVNAMPLDIGMGVNEARDIFVRDGREYFRLICDGNYVLWKYVVM